MLDLTKICGLKKMKKEINRKYENEREIKKYECTIVYNFYRVRSKYSWNSSHIIWGMARIYREGIKKKNEKVE